MNKTVYNILWADDQIDDIYNDNMKELFISNDINVIEPLLHNSVELKDALHKMSYRVHAVIVDGNFTEDGYVTESERDVSGLSLVRGMIDNHRNKIPFILYSQRNQATLIEECKWLEKEFKFGVNWFDKDVDINEFITAIKKQVETYSSPNFIIQNQYKSILEAANKLDAYKPSLECEKFICEVLIKNHTHKWEYDNESTKQYFNSLRGIVEVITDVCIECKIIPNIEEVNKRCEFLNNYRDHGIMAIDGKQYHFCNGIREQVMPSALGYSLNYAMAIINDGSHYKTSLNLKVQDFVFFHENSDLFKSTFHVIISLLQWFDNYVCNNLDAERNQKYWEIYTGNIDTHSKSERQAFAQNKVK